MRSPRRSHARPAASAPRSAPTQGFPNSSCATEGSTARCWTTATRYAPLVVTTLHPKTAFLDQIPHAELPDDFVRDIEHWKTRSGVVKINLALGELPNFTADPSSGLAEHHTGSVEMAPTVDYIEAAFQDARRAAGPDAVQRRCHPHHPGHHAQSRWYAHHVAVHTVGARRVERRAAAEELDAYADRLIDLYDQVAPNFKSSITHRDIVGPYEMEQEYGLIGGNIFHGELAGAVVPHASRAGLRRLPHAHRRAVQRRLRYACRRGRVWHPGLAGRPRRARHEAGGRRVLAALGRRS